ncbi:GDP-mannose 4,6-dehydratase [Paracoccaceae bacterium]|nr:GDP-mannose 4,6-dehydratase [Paracoccaceae bacterium]
MKKTALITGISGMVGSHLADLLIKKTDWNIVGMVRWRSPLDNLEHLVHKINEGKRISLVYGDLTDPSSLELVASQTKFDFVFHLAAQSYPQTSFTAPLDTFTTNINGTMALLSSIRTHSPESLIHVCSSSEVYGRVPKELVPIKEDCTFHPASPYAISKVGTDLVGRYFAEAYGMNVMCTRMFTHTGPRRGDVFAESTFAKQIALIEAGFMKPVLYVGNLDSYRTFADVRDAVRAYYMLLTMNPQRGESYNIGGQHSCSVGEMLAFLLSKSVVKDIEVKVDPTRLRPIDADLQVPNSEKFTKHTGWEPEYTFEQTMEDLLNYWREKVAVRGDSFLKR